MALEVALVSKLEVLEDIQRGPGLVRNLIGGTPAETDPANDVPLGDTFVLKRVIQSMDIRIFRNIRVLDSATSRFYRKD